MSDKNLQETKQLNAQARANSTPDGASKISLTQPSAGQGFTNTVASSGLEEAKELNKKSRQGNTK
jgi:hypothetical protein